ncbi:FAD-binding and (Fe-S)-binding domain-containing protein [Cobetia sp. UCD-24C]|uniref:FAD-binding and (Fe-S)-binding domain-containing protein n=1 Tax=Cobetia sp. UCD-24C TaxID=1716176 RepID=UPI0006CA18E0|nr:FAD-binding and (Fe-S)-binding domain-containing protein [Cobetia sp. UCD-24C]KPM82043.1 FAD-linked oxidase [Cobetia sp. UCD-24C]
MTERLLDMPAPVDSLYLDFLAALRDAGFAGDISPDYANRTVLSTDNSLYQVLPQAVVYPRHAEDVQRIARLSHEPRFSGVTLAPRGGGTGTNGQSLNDGVLVDVSRHMNRILEIDVENRRVRVEAGVVKDQLNAALKPHGLFFAPELSTSNRATIGGMINTDASGQGSCEYGKTRDHVLALDSVLLDGTRLSSHAIDDAELETLCAREDRVGEVYRTARAIADERAEEIADIFPPLNRCLTGYDLAHLREADGRFNLNSLLCGAEGTLGFVVEAELNALPIAPCSTLINLRYASFMDALRDAKALMAVEGNRPTSIETVDDTVLNLAMQDFVWDSVEEFFPASAEGTPAIGGINLIEFNADSEEVLDAKVRAFSEHLASDTSVERLGFTEARGRAQIGRVYGMRKRSVGLLGNVDGEARPLPFVEDTAVPPEHLADYIAEFRAALDARGLRYGMFGHVDAGVLHVRPALDMKDPAQQAMIREISDEVAALTHKYGGLLWGEHGKGVRSEYSPRFFGSLYGALQDVKAAFDPHNQLNPGKIASPRLSVALVEDAGASDAGASEGASEGGSESAKRDHADSTVEAFDPRLMRIDDVTMRGDLDRQIDERVWQEYASAVYCNGNGACYNYDPNDAMCPSWKATRQRIHSPKGRASLMREWLRLEGNAGRDVIAEAQAARTPGLKGTGMWLARLPARISASLKARRAGTAQAEGQSDANFDQQVYDAMSGCLACKSCAGQCPIKVNVPDFRSRFLEVYHHRYQRPLRDYLIGSLEFVLPWAERVTPLYNGLLTNKLVSRLLEGPIGMVDAPRLSRASLRRQLKSWGVSEATPTQLGRLTESQKARSVILVQDAFTSHFEAQLVIDIIELLSRLDIHVFVAPFAPNGKPLQVQGFTGAFQRTARAQADRLKAIADFGVPLVGIDPAMTLTYRQEYVKTLGPDAVPDVLLLQEWLISLRKLLPVGVTKTVLGKMDPGMKLLSHCTESTNAPGSAKAWQQVYSAFGLKLETIATGCCGMSGTYGHEARNLETSRAIYDLSWKAVVEDDANQGKLVASGYSCRSQSKRFSGSQLPHPLQALLPLLRRAQ